MCTVPTGGGKDSVCTAPTGGGKDSVCTVPTRGRENSVCTGYIQTSSVQKCIYSRKSEKPASGGRLRQFLPEWEKQGSHRLIIGLIRDGYKLPFRECPNLSRVPCIVSSYAGFDKQNALWTSSQDLLQKGAVEVFHTSDSLGFYSPKTRQPLEATHRLKLTKQIPSHPKVKDGDPRVHTCLTDAYLHVPIHTQSQKYLRFHFKGVTYQFTSLPFGLATAPLIFTGIIKLVKLIALQSGIRLHQYLDDWLIRAPSEQECRDQIQKLQKLEKDLGFIVNLKKSEFKPSQRFVFLGYHFSLDLALVKPTQDWWTKLQMFHRLSLKSVISARTLMSTIGLLASTEKTVKLGRMHMRPFQWHLKTQWKYPMPLDTPIPWNQKMI